MVRDQSEKVVVEGPVNLDETVGAFRLPLYTANSFRVSNQTETNQESIATFDSEDAFLAPLEGSRDIRVDGDASFSRVNQGYPSLDVKDSVRQWLASFEALVLPGQGLGWKVIDEVRGTVYEPVSTEDDKRRGLLFSTVTWEHDASDGQRFSYNFDGEFSEGVQRPNDPSRYVEKVRIDDPPEVDRLEVDGYQIEFDSVDQRRVRRNVELNSTELIHQEDDSPMTGLIESGVETEVRFRGIAILPDNFESSIQQFDTEIQGKTAVINDAFAGRRWSGTIGQSSSTIESGQAANQFEIEVQLDVGNVISD